MDKNRFEVMKVNHSIASILFFRIDVPLSNKSIVIAQGCGQTLGLGLVDRNRTVVNY